MTPYLCQIQGKGDSSISLLDFIQIRKLPAMTRIYLFILCLLLAGTSSTLAQKTGLLIVDIQEFYFPGGRMQLQNPELAGMNTGLLLDHFRKNALHVYLSLIHI